MRERKYILAQYDISGIQDYIFATNRLRENVGASYNVNRILNLFLPDAINEAVKTEGGFALINWNTEKSEFQFESNQEILAEVLYIGGGNAVVIYRNRRLYDKSQPYFCNQGSGELPRDYCFIGFCGNQIGRLLQRNRRT